MSSHTTARIAGSGSFVPDTRVDNFELYTLDSIREDFDIERARGALRDVENADALRVEGLQSETEPALSDFPADGIPGALYVVEKAPEPAP